MESIYKIVFSLTASIFSFWMGGWDLLIQYLVIFVVLDYVTGMLKGFKRKGLSSNIGWKGLLKKVAIFVVIGIAHGIDILLLDGVPDNLAGESFPTLRTLVIWAYIINEIISILENIEESGAYVPNPLRKALRHLDKNTNNSFSSKEEQE
ncbi:phage holin family protein [Shouchella patagoniensis]|uniref:phage holin family protein n=1 Tax=Shouchella patagoniensis TaxID=228576 RepID=UPI000994B4B7|nr:phage holin family protein [Shouchella patagoniensis]